MLTYLAAVLVGLGLLIVGADQLVKGSARIAVTKRLPAVVVGAVVIGLGTSAPEILVSVLAAWGGSLEIAVGNIVGSNMTNVTLVLGVAALIVPVMVSSPILRREAPLSAGAAILFAILLMDGEFSRLDAAALLTALALTAWIVLRPRAADPDAEARLSEFVDPRGHYPLRTETLRSLLGLAGTVGGAQLLVWGARGIATDLDLAEGFIGVSLVAVGTSLPELVSTVQSARRRQHDLIMGNLLGSNIMNSLVAGGVAGMLGPGTIADPSLTRFTIWAMAIVAAGGTLLMGTGRQVVRWEAIVLLVAFVGTLLLAAR
jgi:cation:H+ antiporter